jgi:hypothetical protein
MQGNFGENSRKICYCCLILHANNTPTIVANSFVQQRKKSMKISADIDRAGKEDKFIQKIQPLKCVECCHWTLQVELWLVLILFKCL